MPDHRDYNHTWYSAFDEKAMTITFAGPETCDCPDGCEKCDENGQRIITARASFEVCNTCDGKGTHVNPNIDRQGLTAEDFADDPDFREDYMSGAYDVPCAECGGRRVVPAISDEETEEVKKAAEQAMTDHYDNEREKWHEREMGY